MCRRAIRVVGVSPLSVACWYDRASQGRTWGEDTVVTGEIDPRARYECSEAGDKVLRSEQHVGGAVAEWVLELVDDLAGGVD